jgi:hypothetical protein
MQFTKFDIQVRNVRPAFLTCHIKLVWHAQNELLHLLELKYKEN